MQLFYPGGLYQQMVCFATINVPPNDQCWTFQCSEADYDHDTDDPYAIEVKTCYSRSLYFMKRYDDALKFDLQYLRLRERACGREHDDIVRGLYRLAFSYCKPGDMPHALSAMEETLQIRLSLHGEADDLTQKLNRQLQRFRNGL